MSLMNMAPAGGEGGNNSGGGAENQNSNANNPGDQGNGGADPKGGASENNGEFKVARPDHVPEKFWDQEKNSVNTDNLLKSYTELEKQLSKAKEKPAAPEKYDYKTSEKLRKDFGLPETISADDPYFSKFSEFAKAEGIPQEQFSKLVDNYLDIELSAGRERMIAEFAKLGSEKEAIQRIKVLRSFGSKYLSKESQSTLASLVDSADAVKLFEELQNLSSKARQPVDDDPSRIDDDLSDEKISALMKDNAYWDKKDPRHKEVHETVRKAFERQEQERKR